MTFTDNVLEVQLAESLKQIQERKIMQANGKSNGTACANTPVPVAIANTNTGNGISPRAALFRKIQRVYAAVKYIQKDKRNAFFNYSYASESAIKAELHEAFTEAGLILLPPEILELADSERDAKGQFLTTTRVRFAIADVDTGEEISGTVYGRGQDNMDKGPYKAITGALKYFLTTTFLIPTGDDPEAVEKPEPVRKPAMGTQAAADAVAQAKIATGNPGTSRPWNTRGEARRMFQTLRERLGEVVFLTEAERYGCRSIEDLLRSPEKAVACFYVLRNLMQEVA